MEARSNALVSAHMVQPDLPGWVSSDRATAARGRPPSHFHFRADQGALLIVDAGATGVRTAITDLHGRIEHELRSPLDITVGPQPWLTAVDALFDELPQSRRTSLQCVVTAHCPSLSRHTIGSLP